MVDVASLARRARASEGGEACVPIAREPGYRLGMGARSSAGRVPDFFVEVVLDPFPDRPRVNPDQLAERAALLGRLRRRGYALSCDDAGVVTCERTVARTAAANEARVASRLLARPLGESRPRPHS